MSFESPDVEKEFPGLYASQGLRDSGEFSEEEERHRKKDSGKKKESKKDRKDKGYMMFEEEDSEEELVADDTRSPSKMKKHSKPSFKFPKKEKTLKIKDKEKDKDREEKKDKEAKKEEKKLKLKKKKLGASSKTDVSGGQGKKAVFGVSLAQAVARSKCHDGIQLPAIFRECIDYIEEFGLSCEGIYRISGVKSKVTALKDAYNSGKPVYLHEHEPNIVASLLKLYLRELPEPVLTAELMPKFEQASTIKNVKEIIEQFQHLIDELPTPNRLLLSWMIVHMTHVIAKENQNKMSLQNVSIVLSPTMQISHRVLNVLFTYSKVLFRDVVIKKYVPPLRPVTSRWSLELPDSPSALEEELRKQESLLSQLHEDLKKRRDTEKEEQVWEVQRVVTQLKRKLKHVKKAQESALEADKKDKELELQKISNLCQPVEKDEILEMKNISNKSVKPQPPHLQKYVPKNQPLEAQPSKKVEEQPPQMDQKSNIKLVPQTKVPSEEVINTNFQNVPKVTEIKQDFGHVDVNIIPVKRQDEVVFSEDVNKQIPDSFSNNRFTGMVVTKVRPEEEKLPLSNVEVGVEKVTESFNKVHILDSVAPSHQVAGKDLEASLHAVPAADASSSVCSSSPNASSSEDDDGSLEEVALQPLVDEEYEELLLEHQALMLEGEELQAIGDELHQKIDTERSEITRLHQDIAELRAIRDALYEDDSSGAATDSSEESEDEEELQEILQQLIHDNQQLKKENAELCEKILQERQTCLNVKVKIRMIQQR